MHSRYHLPYRVEWFFLSCGAIPAFSRKHFALFHVHRNNGIHRCGFCRMISALVMPCSTRPMRGTWRGNPPQPPWECRHKLEEGPLYRGFCLFRVSPFSAFGDIVTVCHGAFHTLFDVCRRKSVFYGAESNRRMRKQIDMRMIGTVLAYLICKAKTPWMK